MVKKSDFVLTPYMRSDDRRATIQILNTLVPYLALWVLAIKAASVSLWLLPPLLALMALFLLRCFSLMHDCGHYSLFRSKTVNRLVGFLLGSINAMPQYAWSRDHAFHHKTNGDWERYRGIGDFLSVEEFSQLSPMDQKIYGITRHLLMTVPGGFFYLAIKPRLALVLGTYDLIRDGLTRQRNGSLDLKNLLDSHQSKHWLTKGEFWDLLFNNIFVVSSWLLLCHLIGTALFLSLYSIVLAIAGAIFICVFFVQHNFEGSYAHTTADWDYLRGAIEGSSYLELPAILRWFTADISYHNIHHLSERIPNYNLAACHHQNSHLLERVKTVRIDNMLDCSKFILWDAAANRLVPLPPSQIDLTVPQP
ncbi:MAG: fatty acid desaturase [Nodosilinea sp.]